MTPTIALLAHKDLNRVAQVARFLSDAGLNICIHIDGNVSAEKFDAFKTSLSNHPNILWPKRIACEWGQFSLVEAPLNMVSEIFSKWPETSHVQLLSGDCLPTRRPSEFIEFLSQHPDTDFIESVSVGNDNWITGGLGAERFTLTFPFSWKKQRWLFDLWVEAQRKLRIKRRAPNGLKPHIGSQWWCLTRGTLQAIIADPQRAQIDAYFRKCWIPDESYFQTMTRKHAQKIESRATLFAHFDHQGKPITFYDDHIHELASFDAFFVRKIWPSASRLYDYYLSEQMGLSSEPQPHPQVLQHINEATDRRKIGRSGLYMHGRAPNQWLKKHSPTATRYSIFTNLSAVFPDFNAWLNGQTQTHAHGRLFAKERVHFADGADSGPGGISADASIRDIAPENFLCNLIWNTRSEGITFHYELADAPSMFDLFASDPNANLFLIRHGWLLQLLDKGISNADFLRFSANALIAQERAYLTGLQESDGACQTHIRTLGDVMTDPLPTLSAVLSASGNFQINAPIVMPEMANSANLMAFARDLRNIGVDIDLTLLEPPSDTTQHEQGQWLEK